jgi:predicted nucleic-acid-binding Zn-ribbon protein
MEYDVKYYQQVADELRASGPLEGLWLKALAVANADKEKAKAFYIQWRVEQIVTAELQQSKNKTNYTIECPKCHTTETIPTAHVKNPSYYKIFNINYNSFLGRITFVCNNCGKTFKKDTQLLI